MIRKKVKSEEIEQLLKDAYSLGYESGYFSYDSKNTWAVEQIEKLNKEASKLGISQDIVKRFKSGKQAGIQAKENESKESSVIEKKHKTKYMEDKKEDDIPEEYDVEELKDELSSYEMPSHTLRPSSDSKPKTDELPEMLKKHHMIEDKPTDE